MYPWPHTCHIYVLLVLSWTHDNLLPYECTCIPQILGQSLKLFVERSCLPFLHMQTSSRSDTDCHCPYHRCCRDTSALHRRWCHAIKHVRQWSCRQYKQKTAMQLPQRSTSWTYTMCAKLQATSSLICHLPSTQPPRALCSQIVHLCSAIHGQ
jgi:hypothetical protein